MLCCVVLCCVVLCCVVLCCVVLCCVVLCGVVWCMYGEGEGGGCGRDVWHACVSMRANDHPANLKMDQ